MGSTRGRGLLKVATLSECWGFYIVHWIGKVAIYQHLTIRDRIPG
jgi:hypothetical protein